MLDLVELDSNCGKANAFRVPTDSVVLVVNHQNFLLGGIGLPTWRLEVECFRYVRYVLVRHDYYLAVQRSACCDCQSWKSPIQGRPSRVNCLQSWKNANIRRLPAVQLRIGRLQISLSQLPGVKLFHASGRFFCYEDQHRSADSPVLRLTSQLKKPDSPGFRLIVK